MGVCSIRRPLAKLQDRGLRWEVEPQPGLPGRSPNQFGRWRMGVCHAPRGGPSPLSSLCVFRWEREDPQWEGRARSLEGVHIVGSSSQSHKILSLPQCVAGGRDFTLPTHAHTPRARSQCHTKRWASPAWVGAVPEAATPVPV